MDIILKEQEFKDAILCYLGNKGFVLDDYDISIRLVQGRGVTPTRAEITLEPKDDAKAPFEPDDINSLEQAEQTEQKNESPFKSPFGNPFNKSA